MIRFFAALFCLLPAMASAADYAVDHAKSRIAFSGTHAGAAFSGAFEKWDALISFDPAHLESSSITVTIDTASAKTGNAMFDGTLPTADWFDVKNFPQATFTSQPIVKNAAGSYTAKGTLTIRDKSAPVQFDFALSDLAQSPVATQFSFTLKRADFGLGEKSDPKAEWVSADIPVTVSLVANRK